MEFQHCKTRNPHFVVLYVHMEDPSQLDNVS